MKVHLVAGARPNFMKIAPLFHAMARSGPFEPVFVHTGQHYDDAMSAAFIRQLGLPEPAVALGVGSGSHAEQVAAVLVGYERACLADRPDWTVVVGDVNSTMACALVAAKLGIPLAHLEAGLRSRDRTMPEEINRVVTDVLADLLWTPSEDATNNLLAEGVAAERIECVGNIMIDAFEMLRSDIEATATSRRLGLPPWSYGVVTLHRPSNVDTADRLGEIVDALVEIAARLPLVFPLHPRTRGRLEAFDLLAPLERAGIQVLQPLGYVEFASLLAEARLVVTDSGGVQEESTYLDVPCLTLRTTTERPLTVEIGTSRLCAPGGLVEAVAVVLADGWPRGRRPAFWDGRTAPRVLASLARRAGVSHPR